MNSFERGRLTGVPGVESKLTWHPDRVSVRLRNSVVRMLRQAHITGSWSSKSRQLAELLCEHYELSIVQTRYHGVRLFCQPTPAVRDELISLIRADMSAFLLSNEAHHTKYYRDQAAEYIDSLERGTASYIDFRSKEFSKQAIALINTTISAEDRKKIDEVIAVIESNTPIHFATLRS